LLLEPQRTNILKYSNTFSNSAWVKLNCSVASNLIISPDGTQNSTTLTSSTTNNFLYNALETANGLYTLSCFVKYLDTDTVNLSMTDFATGDVIAKFNFSTGLFNTPIVSGSFTNTATNVITLDNGWFKISLTSQKNAGTILSSRIDGLAVGKSVYVYAAQTELGSYPTSYIPTTTTAVTRVADSASKSGISSLIGQTEGVLYAEISTNNDTATKTITLSDGTSNNRIQLFYFNGVAIYGSCSSAGANQALIFTNIDVSNNIKVAFKYKVNDFALWVNGVKVAFDTTGAVPTNLNTLIFNNASGLSDFYGNVQNLMIFPSALSDTELATLTTI